MSESAEFYKARYFAEHEVRGLAPRLVVMLDRARELAGIPFVITSGKRDLEQNDLAGGVKDSSHLKGLAVDLRVVELPVSPSRARFMIVKALLDVGFNRIGIYDRHIHVDCDLAAPRDVVWTGKSS